jgi:hypothetical protein
MPRVRILLALLVALLLAATDTFVVTTQAAAAKRCDLHLASPLSVDRMVATITDSSSGTCRVSATLENAEALRADGRPARVTSGPLDAPGAIPHIKISRKHPLAVSLRFYGGPDQGRQRARCWRADAVALEVRAHPWLRARTQGPFTICAGPAPAFGYGELHRAAR